MTAEVPRPDVSVPKWPDGEIKPERFWSEQERGVVAFQREHLAAWENDQKNARKNQRAGERQKAREAREAKGS